MERHVPAPTRAGFIGAGRVARALAHAARRAGIDVVAAWSPTLASRQRLAAEFGIPAASSPEDAIRGCDLVIVAVPDERLASAVADVLVRVPVGASPLVVVTSGSASIEALADGTLPPGGASADAGATGLPRIVRVHPLRAITGAEAPDAMDGVVSAVTALLAADLDAARELAVRLGMRPVDLPDAAAPAWHAAGALAAGGVVTLLAAARDLAVATGVDERLALEAMSALARGAIDRAAEEGPEAGLTGPVVRGDAATVASHVGALAASSPALLPLHAELTRATVRLATAGGRIDADTAARIDAELVEPAPTEVPAWA